MPYSGQCSSEAVPDAEVQAAPFTTEAVVQADRADRRDDAEADPSADIRRELGVLPETGPQVRVIELEGAPGTPGVADVHEQHPGERLREGATILRADQEHVAAPESVFQVTTHRVDAADEELLVERQPAGRG